MADLSAGTASLDIEADFSTLDKQLQGEGTAAFSSFAANAGKLVAGALVGKKLFDFAEAGFDELKHAEVVMAQTEATIKSTGGVAGVTSAQVDELGKSLSDLSGKDHLAIQSSENLLLAFKNVRNAAGEGNDIFNRATVAALDLSTAFGKDLSGSATLLGRALNNPIKGIAALAKVGVSFTADQKELIKSLVATGDLLGAQKILLAGLEQQVGGSAKAYGDTLAGQMDKATNAAKEAKAALVAGLAPALELGAKLATSAAERIRDLPEGLQVAIGSFIELGSAVFAVSQPLAALSSIYKSLTGATEAAAVAQQALTVTEVEGEAASVGLFAALGPVGIAAAAIAATAAIAAFVLTQGSATRGADDFAKAIGEDNGVLGKHVDAVLATQLANSDSARAAHDAGLSYGVLGRAVKEGGDNFGEYGRILAHAKGDQVGIAGTADQVAESLRRAGAGGTEFGQSLIYLVGSGKLSTKQAGDLVGALEELHNGEAKGKATADALAESQKGVGETASGAVPDLSANEDAVKQLTEAHDALAKSLQGVADGFDKAYNRELSPTELLSNLGQNIRDLTKSLFDNGFELDANTEKGRKNFEALTKTGDGVIALAKDTFEHTHSLQAAKDAGAFYVQGLREQYIAAGYTEEQVQQMIETMHLTPEQLATIFSTNSPETKAAVQGVLDKMTEIPDSKRTELQAMIDGGSYDSVLIALDQLSRPRQVYFAPTGQFRSGPDEGRSAGGNATGGPVFAGDVRSIAERGRELVLYDRPSIVRHPADGIVLNTQSTDLAFANMGRGSGGSKGMSIEGNVVIHTDASPRQWFEEIQWQKLAG